MSETKGCGHVRFVMMELRREELKGKLPIVRMEIDYELLTLYDALQVNDTVQIIKSKDRLQQLRHQLLMINEV